MMRERIITAPGANGAELIKSLAMHGVNCFNLRITGAGELARIALMRSGIAVTEDFVSAREETALMAEAVKGEAFFGKATYSDIREIAAAVRRIRTLVPDAGEEGRIEEILKKGTFEKKNEALISVYKKYKKLISGRKLMDSVALIRKAIAECRSIDADFIILEEYPPNPLEKALIEKLSGGNIKESSLSELFHLEEAPLKIGSFKNCYGAANEVETILTDIYSGKRPDRCTVAVTDSSSYGQLFFDYALLYDIPVTFGCGIPIINSNPARLLVLYYRWMTGGFFGASAIDSMLSSAAFDRSKLYELYPEKDENFSWRTYAKVLGGIRLTNDRAVNDRRIADYKKALTEEEAKTDPQDEKAYKSFLRKKLCIPYLEVLSEELSMPAEDFIAKYSLIRKGSDTNAQILLMQLDLASLSAIYEELKVIRASGVEQAAEDMILNVLRMSVGAARSEEGKLFVTGIDKALTTVRDNLYIAGLSASNYPGSPRENYLLLDDDLDLFGEAAKSMNSIGVIGRRRDRLMTLARLASRLGSDISVSFAGLNVSELKRDNASSLIYELYREESKKAATSKELEEHIINVDYFTPAISVTRKVGEAYNEGKTVLPRPAEKERKAPSVHPDPEREYSPSDLDPFFACPRAFMLGNVLGIPSPDEERPFEVIGAADAGTMAHSLMEELGNSDMSPEDFRELSEEYFDRFIAQHPPLVAQGAGAEKEQFLDMMETAYETDPHREVVLDEEAVHCVHESGVKLWGYPDRVEKLEDGSFLVVDFKTGRSIGHEQDDINTCMQIVIYAYLLEKKGYRIAGGEYRYIRLGETVTCKYDDEMKQALADRLTLFRQHLLNADYPIPDNAYAEKRSNGDPDPCKYCKFGGICGKDQETEGDER
ncbi:MAG: PD-(D/E)XK nuclease family protein [Lachnospiraceae bacterium]|nr:PD-(D/E)XK nuclease family protein [Lachnospiraceae bacterium]